MSTELWAGILPFDSDDSSIVLKCALTTAASVAAPAVGPAGTITGSGHTFNGVYGFKPAAAGNSGITFTDSPGYANLDYAGQLSFEISREVVCANQSSVGSSGTSPGGVQWTLVWGNGTNTGSLRKVGGTPSSFQTRAHNSSDTASISYIHSENKDAMVRVTYSWLGANVWLWVDGKPVSAWTTAPTRNTLWADQFKNISVMSSSGGVNPERDGYMRNLIVSTKPANPPVHPGKRVAFLGHSFSVTYSNLAVNNDNYEITIANELRKLAMKSGYDLDTAAFGIGGAYWDRSLTGLDIYDYVNTAMAYLPQYLVCYGPTNDVGNAGYVAGTTDSDIKLALGLVAAHNNINNLVKIIFCNTPSRYGLSDSSWSPSTQGNIRAANALIDLLPAYWNTTYPTQAGKLVVCDLFSAWGGMAPSAQVMVGQRAGTFANLHPSGLGCFIAARAIWDKM